MPTIRIRTTSPAAVSVALVLLAGAATPADAAANHPSGPGSGMARTFDFQNDASYVLDMRNAGVEENTPIPAYTYQDIGFSGVQLTHDIGQPEARCDSRGAGYFFGQYVEEAVLEKGAAPPDAGDVSGGYANPVMSRSVKPDVSAGGTNLTDRHPFIQNPFPPGNEVTKLPNDGTPLYINSNCADDVKGSGTGNVFDVAKVADVIGSTTEAGVDRVTGEYVSTARAYVAGIKGAGPLTALSSFMTVKQTPGSDPVVTYRMSLFDNDSGGSVTGWNQSGITLSGNNVPANQLTDQFNSQLSTVSGALAALGPFGIRVMAPDTGIEPANDTGTGSGGHYVTAPSVQVDYGLHARDGGIGQHQVTRLGAISFTGVYGDH
ncbi:MAG TPA: hypothetical protein VHV82_00005 [Sporichthyaceae bacterium]|nr:hypothetical protein [Sporichthyaceae bacterium]